MWNSGRVLAAAGSGLALLAGSLLPSGSGVAQATAQTEGEKLFRAKCAPCHGENGKGGGGFSKALVGSLSVGELAKYIGKAMPPGKPAPPAEAAKVAAFMHDAFYSPVAQERNRPARVSLARLTARQYRNAVTDLIDGFQPFPDPASAKGLTGSYFRDRGFNGAQKGFDRVDPGIDLDFQDKAPSEDKFDPHNFSIQWQGSLIAPDSGDYEFVVRSSHAVRLWFNGGKTPLIDAWVKSGNDTEFKGTARLAAGRAYPLRLEYSKATQGVNDDEKRKKTPPAKAFIQFLWSPPKRPVELVPSVVLVPQGRRPSYVVATPFPPDDRSMGYERGTDISKEWGDATTSAALEAAAYLTDNLQAIVGVPPTDPNAVAKAKEFAERFVARAFRKPLDEPTRKLFVDRQFEGSSDAIASLKKSVVLALKSPRFLYREPGMDSKDPYAVASKLSFALWDTIPDDALLQAAASGALAKPEGVRAQAERLANDPRAWNKLRDFLMLWLKVDDIPSIVKNAKSFPGFDAAASADLRTGFELFLRNAVWTEASDFRELFLNKTVYMNSRLARIYGAKEEGATESQFRPVQMDGGKRFGVVTSPYVLSRMAYLDATSPIHRGVLIARNLLGRTLSPPPIAVAPAAEGLHPGLTTRERVAMQTKPAACASCHTLINPLGFTLEGYDAIGRIRTQDRGKKVDASGHFRTRSGQLVRMNGAGDLARFLATNEETHGAFVEKLFHHLAKQPVRAYGTETLGTLRKSLAANGFSIRKLMVEAAVLTATSQGSAKPVVSSAGGK